MQALLSYQLTVKLRKRCIIFAEAAPMLKSDTKCYIIVYML